MSACGKGVNCKGTYLEALNMETRYPAKDVDMPTCTPYVTMNVMGINIPIE
jgi:hypothetical protein